MQPVTTKQKPIVKLVAIAKDEGAYFPEWIGHHLLFGFDKIEIYINRTTDNSVEILNKICSSYNNVSYQNFDWIDMCAPGAKTALQSVAYAHAIGQARQKKDCTHILFIDIDEFWVSVDFNSTIQDCIESLGHPEAISFEWAIIHDETIEFSPIKQKLRYSMNFNVKTLFDIECKIEATTPHMPIFGEPIQHLLANGNAFRCKDDSSPTVLASELNSLKPYVVLHRMYRSEIEYLAALYRGIPQHNRKIKPNRTFGFRSVSESTLTYEIEEDKYGKYISALSQFLKPYSNDLGQAQLHVRHRAQQTIDSIVKIGVCDISGITKSLNGLTNLDVQRELTKVSALVEDIDKKTINAESTKDVRKLYGLALIYESQNNIPAAYACIKKAIKIRPGGPMLLQKLNQYETVL